MPVVRVEPAGLEFEVLPEEAVAEAAWRHGYHWPTRCYGQAECMVCYTRILAGELAVEPPGDYELEQMDALLPRLWRHPSTRLACQLRILGPGVVLAKEGVRAP